jgi:crotonobetainyl-CoA:carnitine CoA-transferase CaiB-like acyl-CoA transferase
MEHDTIDEPRADLPLAGVKVADFTRMLAGPVATMTLADLGADVIKIEDPDQGDRTRTIGVKGAMFWVANRNKRSACIDLKHPTGLAVARELIARSDVVVESFRPGVMDGLGLGFEAVRELNEKVVYASLNGFGSTGPDRDRRGVDLVMQAESGLMALSGEPGGPPLKAGFQLIDESGGLALAQAVLAALFRRERTGRGGHVEVRLLDVALFVQSMQVTEFSITGNQPPRLGNSVAHAAPSDMVTAKDGGLMISSYFESDWQALCRVLDLEWMIPDERFQGVEARIANRQAMLDSLNSQFVTRTRAEWYEVLNKIGIMVGVVNEYADVVAHPQVVHNGSLRQVEVGLDGPVRIVGQPYSIDGRPMPHDVVRPPRLGAHTVEVLQSLGHSQTEVESMLASGAFGTPEAAEGSGE